MEMSMYQENDNGKTQPQQLKRNNMFLDFASGNTKHQKYQSMLASPDLNMLKLASPELEKMLVAQNGMMTTTPTPTQFVYPKYVTDEQEAYARGFVEALAELHSGPGGPGAPPGMADGLPQMTTSGSTTTKDSSNTSTYTSLMPMSTASITTPASATSQALTSAATTLANMNGNHGGFPRRHPHPFVPSSLAVPNPPKPMSTIPSSTIPSSSAAYNSVHVKEEPAASHIDQTVPRSPATSSRITDSPPLSPVSSTGYDDMNGQFDGLPVNMEAQEKIKLERKRARNRIAARKCRTRKLERISRLEEKVSDLKSRNNELQQTASSLGEQVMQLKQQIMEHMKSGCQIMMPDMRSMGGL